MKKTRSRIAMLVLAAICLVALLGCSALGISLMRPVTRHSGEYFPKEGTWYCDELQMQIDFDDKNGSYYLIDNERISLTGYLDETTNILMMKCQQPDCKYCEYHSFVAALKFVELSETQLVVEDRYALPEVVHYTFECIEE